MKLRLCQTLRAALLATLSLNPTIWCTLGTGTIYADTTDLSSSETESIEYTITDSSSASAARSSTEDDTIVINLVHDSSATKNDNYLPNATTTDVTYTASTITIKNMDISNGYGSGLSSSKLASFYFNGTVVGDGDINFYNWSSTSCYQEYIFTGDLSNYSGDITSGKADNVTDATYSGGALPHLYRHIEHRSVGHRQYLPNR